MNTRDCFVCPLVEQYKYPLTLNPDLYSPGLVVRLEGSNSGRDIYAGVLHWSYHNYLYLYLGDLTLSEVRRALTPGRVNVYYDGRASTSRPRDCFNSWIGGYSYDQVYNDPNYDRHWLPCDGGGTCYAC